MPDHQARRTRFFELPTCLWLILVVGTVALPMFGFASEQRETPIVKAVQRAKDSVVNIRGEKTIATPVSQTGGIDSARRVNGMGTGVVIDPHGYIITNYHVVDGVRDIQVTLADEKRYMAALVARDLETDLAIIKIDCPKELPVIPIGTSSDLMTGETVIAMGNAFGYEHTVTRGIISALHRPVQVSDAQFYDDLIQTDASINPGNSGGPLLNIDGDMIGVNVAVRAGAQGIGFAIPADKALAVAAKLLGSNNIQKTWHGVVFSADGSPSEKGATVASVESKSPAAEIGIQGGDRITAVGETIIKQPLDFQRAMLNHAAGEKINITTDRSGEKRTINLTLADPPSQGKPSARPAWDVLGLELKPIPAQDFKTTYHSKYRGGLTVTDVRPDSPAANQGIKTGDVLVGMHVWETVSLENVAYILKRPDLSTISPLKFFILRGNDTLYGYMPLPVKVAQR
jgi:serine protease Do